MSGNMHEFFLEQGATVGGLKHELHGIVRLPPECHKLLSGSTLLADSEQIADHCESGAMSLDLTLVISLEQQEHELSDITTPDRQLHAIHVLSGALWGLMSDDDPEGQRISRLVRNVMGTCLSDGEGAKVLALGDFMKGLIERKGEDETRERLFAYMDLALLDPSKILRSCAIASLPYIVGKNDERAVAAACRGLADPEEVVRAMAQGTLHYIVERGNAPAVSALLAQLERANHFGSQISILQVLPLLANRGDGVVRDAVEHYLVSFRSEVRVAAIRSLSAVSGSQITLTLIRLVLEQDEDALVQDAAAEVLASYARLGNSCALSNLAACLMGVSERVRRLAVHALSQAARKGDAFMVYLMCTCLEDEDEGVAFAALEVLPAVAHVPDAATLAQLQPELTHEQAAVRRTALRWIASEARRSVGGSRSGGE